MVSKLQEIKHVKDVYKKKGNFGRSGFDLFRKKKEKEKLQLHSSQAKSM